MKNENFTCRPQQMSQNYVEKGCGAHFHFLKVLSTKMLSLYFEFIRLFCSEANWFSKKQNFSLRFFLLMFGLRVMVKRDGRTG